MDEPLSTTNDLFVKTVVSLNTFNVLRTANELRFCGMGAVRTAGHVERPTVTCTANLLLNYELAEVRTADRVQEPAI